ncbi:hypothetical protein [Nonomuraea dietziae]|uniref:hypothetical protein n=1 Tax=Nonomuraea dietziae TaxID=65515 RepID=UPI00343B1283
MARDPFPWLLACKEAVDPLVHHIVRYHGEIRQTVFAWKPHLNAKRRSELVRKGGRLINRRGKAKMINGAIGPGRSPRDSAQAAEWLKLALVDLGIPADVHVGTGVALVSVWVDLVVWSDGASYQWWSGEKSEKTGRWKYLYGPATDPVTVARRVADRFDKLSREHPLSGLIHGVLSEVSTVEMAVPE